MTNFYQHNLSFMNETVLQTEISNYDLNTNEIKQFLKQVNRIDVKTNQITEDTNDQKTY